MPALYDIEKALLDFPVKYDESMNTVLTQVRSRERSLLRGLASWQQCCTNSH